jgi:hypothetical protein
MYEVHLAVDLWKGKFGNTMAHLVTPPTGLIYIETPLEWHLDKYQQGGSTKWYVYRSLLTFISGCWLELALVPLLKNFLQSLLKLLKLLLGENAGLNVRPGVGY